MTVYLRRGWFVHQIVRACLFPGAQKLPELSEHLERREYALHRRDSSRFERNGPCARPGGL